MTDIKLDVKALLEEERRKHKVVVDNLNNQIRELQGMVLYERERREYVEKKLAEIETSASGKKSRKSPKQEKEYTEYKRDGVIKKTKVDSIRSYSDFRKIQDYFLNKNQIRNYALWTIGVCMGVRSSDLLPLKWKNFLNQDLSFRDRIKLYEKKTSKVQDCLITEAMKEAATALLNNLNWNVSLEDYLFPGRSKESPLEYSVLWRILVKAAKESGVNIHIGTHTMRESFCNIVLCVDKSTIDMNAITKIQGLLNHSDARITMRYLGKFDEMCDKARQTVSDFVLGKTGVDELVCGQGNDLQIVMQKLDELTRAIDDCEN